MVDAGRHPKIHILSYSEVEEVRGFVGNFKVKVKQKPRYVIPEKCNGCGDCVDVCPIEVPNSFDEGVTTRKAIYVPFAQAVPSVYTIDMDACIECYKCIEACGKLEAIDFSQKEEIIELDIGTIIVATGYDIYDPTPIKQYGYGRYLNVLTALELERLLDESGPTMGKLYRPSDKKVPKKLAFIQCVGSRDEKVYEYCSGFCCMYTIKNSLILREKYPDLDISIYYMDIRTPSKGYEEFYRRAREEGIKFIQGKPSEIAQDPNNHNLFIYSEDLAKGKAIRDEVDIVILSTAAEPRPDSRTLGSKLGVTSGPSGFYMESHPKLKPIDTPTEGVFIAGSSQGPKDIPYSVAQGSAASSRAGRILSSPEWEIEPLIAFVDADKCRNVRKKCGICETRCPYGAIIAPEGKPAYVIGAKCHGCGTCVADCPEGAITQMHYTDVQIVAQIHAILREKPEEKILVFTCHWCSFGAADTAGNSHLKYPPDNRIIKVMCSGRLDRKFIYESFRMGAGMVLASGCHPQDCHYITGQHHAERRLKAVPKILERAGISPKRFRVEWMSAAEGQTFSKVMKELSETLKSIGIERIKEENEKSKPELEKRIKTFREDPDVAKIIVADEKVDIEA